VAKPDGYGIYLVDTLGGRELLYRDPRTCCFAPTPVQPRPAPPVIPSSLAPDREDGTFVIQNVYDSIGKLAPGSVKSVRVVRIFEQPTAASPVRSVVDQEVVKSVLGTVPVNADGSVAFKAPAQVPLLLQLLDENNVSLFGMRSQVYLQRGETMSCAGCHEPRGTTAVPGRTIASATPRDLTPSPGPSYPGGFSFARTVQPVLDRYCIRCHGLGHHSGGLGLLGTPTAQFSEAYETLVSRPGLVSLAHRNVQTEISKPGDYGARAGKLAGFLLGHHRQQAALDPDSFTRLAEWLDLNCQYYGDYSFERRERRAPSDEGVKALRDHVRQACASCHAGLADQPLAALVNLALPEESRVLKAPLAAASGGWGQCRQAWGDTAAEGYGRMRERVLAATGEP
jgi:mono/diheme cytochrome c family protein